MMKPVTLYKSVMLMAMTLCAINASAYNDDKKKELCRPPKIQEFTLPIYSESNKKEAQPEQEFTFVVSGWANPKKIKLMGKGKAIPFTVQSTETYHKVKAKLPSDFSGQTVRISTRITAVLECYSTIGWLVKVAGKPAAEIAKPAESSAPAAATANEGTMPAKSPTTTSAPASKAATTDPATTAVPSEKPSAAP
jgi:hypothetical protein